MHIEPNWLGLVEKRLTRTEQARLDTHLAGCPACRDEVAQRRELICALEAMPLALRDLPRRRVSPWPAIWARVRAPSPAAPPVCRWHLVTSLSLMLVWISLFLSAFGPSPDGSWSTTADRASNSVAALHTPLAPTRLDRAASAATAPSARSLPPLRPAPVPTPDPGPTS